jgi:hypothetical protein
MEKVTVIDKIEIVETGHVQVRRVTRIVEDGHTIATTETHRHVLAPGDDLSAEDPRVAAVARAVWGVEGAAHG